MTEESTPLPQESPALRDAFDRCFESIDELKHSLAPKMPPAAPFDQFFKPLRGRDSDDPFLCENPRP